MCDLDTLRLAAERVYSRFSIGFYAQPAESGGCGTGQSSGLRLINVMQTSVQHHHAIKASRSFVELAESVSTRYGSQHLRVLRIGGRQIGILLVLPKDNNGGSAHWHRLEICQWSDSGPEGVYPSLWSRCPIAANRKDSALDILNFRSNDWTEYEGRFG